MHKALKSAISGGGQKGSHISMLL